MIQKRGRIFGIGDINDRLIELLEFEIELIVCGCFGLVTLLDVGKWERRRKAKNQAETGGHQMAMNGMDALAHTEPTENGSSDTTTLNRDLPPGGSAEGPGMG